MGKFINTQRKDIMNNLIDGLKERIKNPYYIHNDKKATIVDYFNVNKEASTLDEGLKIEYEQVGSNSPFRYNMIKDMYLYGGFQQLDVQIENGDFGFEGGMNSTTYVLPNTIEPCPGDMFVISYLDKKFLFIVTSAEIDTIESGANFYKLEFEYSQYLYEDIIKQVVNEYKMIIDNVGTNFRPIIKSEQYDLISIMDEICIKLKEYFIKLFFRNRVETFVYKPYEEFFYDPYMIEFILNNNILEGSEEYVYVCHQLVNNTRFILDYDKTIFRKLETKDKNINKSVYIHGKFIEQKLSILSMYLEPYFKVDYVDKEMIEFVNAPSITFISEEDIDNIISGTIYEDNRLVNFIIKYFNNIDIGKEDLDYLENLNYSDTVDLFYMIPIILFILENKIKKTLIDK